MHTSALKNYLQELEKRYQGHYDVEKNHFIADEKFDIFAVSVIEHFRNILTKKIKIDQYQEKEFVLVKGFDQIVSLEEMQNFSQSLIKATQQLVNPSMQTMSHIVNGIAISNQGFSKDVIHFVQKFRYAKTFCLGIKGWCDIRLLLIDLQKADIHCNTKGLEVKSVYSFNRKKM